MKLVNHITFRLSGIFILILLVWSVVYFFIQMKEIHDGIDEGLNNLRQEFIYKANHSEGFVSDMERHNPLNIIVEKISYDEAKDFKEIYTDSKVYFITEEEEEEVRMLTTAFFCEQDGQYYRLKFFTSTVESDDLIKNMLILLLALWLSLGLAIAIVIKVVIHRSNKPFYKLLDNLKGFRLDNTRMIELPSTDISEYSELNESVKGLLEENIRAFTEQKNFIENASHEIQTPLTIVISKMELLMSDRRLRQEQLEEMNVILNSLNRMRRLNSSLLLLSKIRNKQFKENEKVDMTDVFEEVLDDFRDLIEYKEIEVKEERNSNPIIHINKDLAYILANNLIKNAVFHNIKGGKIFLTFNAGSIIISNTGAAIGNNVDIFERYVSGNNDSKSSGLGLSIVKSITTIYNIPIRYIYKDNKHVMTLTIA